MSMRLQSSPEGVYLLVADTDAKVVTLQDPLGSSYRLWLSTLGEPANRSSKFLIKSELDRR